VPLLRKCHSLGYVPWTGRYLSGIFKGIEALCKQSYNNGTTSNKTAFACRSVPHIPPSGQTWTGRLQPLERRVFERF